MSIIKSSFDDFLDLNSKCPYSDYFTVHLVIVYKRKFFGLWQDSVNPNILRVSRNGFSIHFHFFSTSACLEPLSTHMRPPLPSAPLLVLLDFLLSLQTHDTISNAIISVYESVILIVL